MNSTANSTEDSIDKEAATELDPVIKELHVPMSPTEAFALFTQGIKRWWPLRSHSCSLDASADLHVPGRAGAQVIEHTTQGKRYVWGTVLVWEPPHRFAMSWHPGTDPEHATRLEVQFAAAGDGCALRVVHAGWSARGASAAGARDQYDRGWVSVLAQFSALAATGS
jgi:uncharacterized protein YndB with AHSA1/START domain